MNNSPSHVMGGCLLIMIVVLISALCWKYSINMWLVFFDKEPVFKLWYGLLLSFVPYIGQAVIPFTALTFILMLFLV